VADANTAIDSSQRRGPRPVAFAETEAVIPTLAWLFGDAMVKRLDAMIAEEADDASALAIPDRQRQAAQIQGDLLAVERDPAWFTWAGLSQGLPVWFGEISPAAILATRYAPTDQRRRIKPRAWRHQHHRRTAMTRDVEPRDRLACLRSPACHRTPPRPPRLGYQKDGHRPQGEGALFVSSDDIWGNRES
jgi:hypothetical protein